jgi:O-antigen ligase
LSGSSAAGSSLRQDPVGATGITFGDLRLPWSGALLAAYAAVLIAIPPDVGLRVSGFVLSPARALLIAAAAVAIAEVVRDRRARPALPPRVVLVAWLLFLAAFGVSTLVNGLPGGISRFGSLVVEGIVVWLLAWHVATRAGADRIATAIAAASVVVAVLSTALALTGQRYDVIVRAIGGDVTAEPAPLRFGVARQQAAFDAPLMYGIWLVAASALVLGEITRSRGVRRWLWIAGWIVVAVAAFTTVSRIVLVGLPLVVAAYFAVRERWRPSAIAFVASIVVAFFVFVVPTGALSNFRVAGMDFSVDFGPPGTVLGVPFSTPEMTAIESSNEARIEAAIAGLNAATERPVFGWGPLNAKAVVAERLGYKNWVDNTYVAFLVEGGVAGLATFVALAFVVLAFAFRNRAEPRGAARAVALLALLGASAFAAFFSLSQGYAAFWLLGGLATGALVPLVARGDTMGDRASAAAGGPKVAHQVPRERGVPHEVAPP